MFFPSFPSLEPEGRNTLNRSRHVFYPAVERQYSRGASTISHYVGIPLSSGVLSGFRGILQLCVAHLVFVPSTRDPCLHLRKYCATILCDVLGEIVVTRALQFPLSNEPYDRREIERGQCNLLSIELLIFVSNCEVLRKNLLLPWKCNSNNSSNNFVLLSKNSTKYWNNVSDTVNVQLIVDMYR